MNQWLLDAAEMDRERQRKLDVRKTGGQLVQVMPELCYHRKKQTISHCLETECIIFCTLNENHNHWPSLWESGLPMQSVSDSEQDVPLSTQ